MLKKGVTAKAAAAPVKTFLYSKRVQRWYCLEDVIASKSGKQVGIIVGLWDNDQGMIPVDDPSRFNAQNNELIYVGRTTSL